MTRKVRALVGGGLVLSLFGGFFYSVMDQGVGAFQYYHTIGEYQTAVTNGQSQEGVGLRLNGQVVPGTIQRDVANGRISFTMTDGQARMPVLVTRLDVSDLFKDDAHVVVEGKVQGGVFIADQLLAKCPTKYEAAEQKTAANTTAQ